MYDISFAIDHAPFAFDEHRARTAIATILKAAGIEEATISVAIVDDPTIHDLNVRFLKHDYPTDVLSFVLEADEQSLEGEVIASADTARQNAERLGWPADDELLLYIVHGTLHLVGYDDLDTESAVVMRQQEREHLAKFGIQAKYDKQPE